MAHTPGPWVFRDPEGDELHEIYAENGGGLICFPVWTANQKANVPLIAAAPELLAALKRLVEYCNNHSDYDAISDADRVIAKAEGRTDEE